MIRNFTPRLYQETILASIISKNSLVVLPTGLGKTNIFLMLAAQRLSQYPNSKILFIGPTRPLIDQYLEVFKKYFEVSSEDMALFTGMVKPEKRAELWNKCNIIFSTPQGLENDIISGRIDLSQVSLLGVDEAHRAVGDYAYVFVAKQYNKLAKYPRILALTASPGSDMEKIKEVCRNLFIENIEIRTEDDPDVKPYIKEMDINWVKVELHPVLKETQKFLKDFLKTRLETLKKWGILQRKSLSSVSKVDLLKLQALLRGRVMSGEKDFVLWNAISVLAEIMKIQHGLELLESQGINALYRYLEKVNKEGLSGKSKAAKNIIKDLNFRSALIKTEKLFEEKIEHPKLVELQRIIEQNISKDKDKKIIVFNQYRDNAEDIKDKINTIEGVKSELFVGQTKKGDTGLSQKEQKKVLDKFREGEFNVLVATSVGEEGLDVPRVDLVIFFEPIPSAIRSIQRRGRTGRHEKGYVIILMTKNTRDEGYRWSSHHKEKKMYTNLNTIKRQMGSFLSEQKATKLTDYYTNSSKVKIYADYREKASGVIKELIDKEVELKLEKLENSDYILSNRVGIEYKTVSDFVDSIIDGRLLAQVKELKKNFSRPLVIIEGNEDLYSVRNIHPNAIHGMLATITVSYGIPVLYTKTHKETASLICTIAKREQEEKSNNFTPHFEKKDLSIKDWQEYVVSSLPGIGMALAKPLLKKFKTVKRIVNAKPEKLEKVSKIGPLKAKKIREVLDEEYV